MGTQLISGMIAINRSTLNPWFHEVLSTTLPLLAQALGRTAERLSVSYLRYAPFA
jgi:hypothetical protein